MRKSLLAVGAAVILLAATACGGGSSADTGGSSGAAATGGTFTFAPLVDHYPWDLGTADGGNEMMYYQAVYDALLRTDDNLQPTPNLATSWSYDDTNTVLTMKLRDDVKFTDGTVLDAEAVKANLLHNKVGTKSSATQLQDIADVTVVDPTTVQITLTQPDSDLLTNLGSAPGMIASPKILDSPTYKTTPVGSGPYTLDTANSTEGSVYTFVRNPDYWNKSAFPWDSLVLKPTFDANAGLNAMVSGQVDAGILFDNKLQGPVEAAGLKWQLLDANSVNALFLFDRAGTVSAPLGNVKVRQALNYAFDRPSLAAALGPNGTSVPTQQNYNTSASGYDAALDQTYTYDVAKAKQLLTEAGYPDGFTLSLPAIAGSETTGANALIKQGLADIGVTVEYVGLPIDQYIAGLSGGQFAAAVFILPGSPSGQVTRLQVAENATWNPFHYTTPEVQTLLGNIKTASGDDAVKAANQAVNKYLVEQAWNVPLFVGKSPIVTGPRVSFVPPVDGSIPLWDFKPAS